MKRTDPNKMILKRHHIVRLRDLNPRDDDNANDDDGAGGMIVDNTRYCPSPHPSMLSMQYVMGLLLLAQS